MVPIDNMSITKCALMLFKVLTVVLNGIAGTMRTAEATRYARSESRIVDGSNVTPVNKFPMIVALRNPDGNVECAGTILDKYHVLTSYRCATSWDLNSVSILAGIYQAIDPDRRYLQTVAIKSATLHERFNDPAKGLYSNDIAVIKLRTPLVWNDYVAPTNLPLPGWTVLPGQEMKATLVGWGKGRDGVYPYPATRPLQELELPLITTEDCQRAWSKTSVTDDHVCVRDVNGAVACFEDDGGPSFIYNEANGKYIQIGIISWFKSNCGETYGGLPSAATKVSNYVSWIQEATRECNSPRSI